MEFNQKLDLLMKVQGVSNSRLARVLSVDPSLISRWRTGSRQPARNSNYIKDISNFFTSYAQMDYQKTAIFEIMGLDYNREQEKIYSISDLLYTWLSEGTAPGKQFVESFFNKLDKQDNLNTSFAQFNNTNPRPEVEQPDFEILYGIEGKRRGVIRFLSAVSAHNKPCTMLLYSDESMEWLTGNKTFFHKWKNLLKEVIARGHKIKIIHTIKRDLSELLSAIDLWLPLYMTGAIEPYYYPKYQEHIFRRTMFIAPGIAALTSNTLSEHTRKAEQFYYTDKSKIDNLVEEYNTFLSMCRPLMRIFTGNNTYNFHKLQLEFEEQPGDIISLSDMLSFPTLPEALLIKLMDNKTNDQKLKDAVLSIHRERFNAFVTNLEKYKHTEIVSLPRPGYLSTPEILLKPNDFFSELNLSYTPLDLCTHIENIIHLLKKYKNYNFLLTEKTPARNTYLAARDEIGAIVGKNGTSPIIFAFNQQNMTNSFNYYLTSITRKILKKERNKKYIVKILSDYMSTVKVNMKT